MGRDFFDDDRLAALLSEEDAGADLTVVYGVGAALTAEAAGGEWEADAFLAYLDVPKNEIQYRSAAGSVRNVGVRSALGPKPMYKCFYFMDWPALSRHKRALLPDIDLVVDTQRPEEPTFMSGDDLRDGLAKMSRCQFVPTELPPTLGAGLLALRKAGREVNESTERHLRCAAESWPHVPAGEATPYNKLPEQPT